MCRKRAVLSYEEVVVSIAKHASGVTARICPSELGGKKKAADGQGKGKAKRGKGIE